MPQLDAYSKKELRKAINKKAKKDIVFPNTAAGALGSFLHQFNNKNCSVVFEEQKCSAAIFYWKTLEDSEFKSYIRDTLMDEMFDYKGYFPFAIISTDCIDFSDQDSFDYQNIDAFLMINMKSRKIFRSNWGEIDTKLEDLFIEVLE